VKVVALTLFLIKAVFISLTGVLAPGPITAATLAAGVRRPHAGALVALGHAAIEFPLMLVILAGAGTLFQSETARIGIGLVGGIVLLIMGVQLALAFGKTNAGDDVNGRRHPFITGMVLSAGNPYFLIWWATVGLALTTEALQFGPLTFALFAVTHWLCDLVWLEALSFASFKGAQVFGDRVQKVILAVCAVALLLFGAKFVIEAGGRWWHPDRPPVETRVESVN
jgi:threonine/homoserine/homoserine lactone efflux protein